MDLYTDRTATPAEEWTEETRNVEVPGMVDRAGRPSVVTIRRLPALEVYLAPKTQSIEELREIYRRWAQLAIVSPKFSFNGSDGPGPAWDGLPFATHEGLASKIAAFSFQTSAAAEAVEAAFRGGEPAGGDDGAAGGGPGRDGSVAPEELPASTSGAEAPPAEGA
jgi:hypothetical protein